MPIPQQRVTADPIVKTTGETLNAGVDFQKLLATDELLTGTPTLTVPSGIAATTPLVNTATFFNRRNRRVPVNKGVTFIVSGGTDKERYEIIVSCATTSSPSQIKEVVCPIEVRNSD